MTLFQKDFCLIIHDILYYCYFGSHADETVYANLYVTKRNENLVEEIVGRYFQYMLESHLKLTNAFAQYRNLCCTCILAMADCLKSNYILL